MIATTFRLVTRHGYATRSRLGMPTIGIPNVWASVRAVVTPTRSPV
jgi:hypothetical protein